MKNQNHQQDKGFYNQDSELVEKILTRGRKKSGVKSASRKPARKTAASTPPVAETARRTKSPKNTMVRKSVSRFMNEGTLFRDTFNEIPSFGHDDYQMRHEMEIDRFVDDDVASAFTVDSMRSLPLELEEGEMQGAYSDQQLVQEIRRAVERDSAVSSAAQKIQLTAKNGVVILKGTVSSEQEQMIIEDKAVALAGFGQVVNQLEVIEDIVE